MSSNIRLQAICQYCNNEFTAKTTVTKYCGDNCAKRAYKAKKRNEKISKQVSETKKVIAKPLEEVKAKDILTVKDVSILLNCSIRTVYRLIENGRIKGVNLSERMIRVKRSEIDKLLI